MSDDNLARAGRAVARGAQSGLTHASFFAGIGGFDLGFEDAGIRTLWQCEINDFCRDILEQHWPEVPRAADIREVQPDDIPDATVWAGGFPCQDVSLARMGPRKGLREASLASSTSLHASSRDAFPLLLSSKTSQVSFRAMEDMTSESSPGRWPSSGMAWHGGYLTAATSESPSPAKESSLSDVIETSDVPERYFLSPNAAAGMLRRADRMGRSLFRPLRRSLEILSRARSTHE